MCEHEWIQQTVHTRVCQKCGSVVVDTEPERHHISDDQAKILGFTRNNLGLLELNTFSFSTYST